MKSSDKKHIISINNLSVIFNKSTVNEVYALKDFSLNVNYGDLFFIRGDNGSGKSTLLNIIKKEIDEFEGEVLIKGKNIRTINDYKIARYTQFVYQNPLQGLCPNLTVYENLFMSLIKNSGVSFRIYNKGIFKKRIVSKLEELGLQIIIEKINESINNLSGGEKQLVNIAKIPLEMPEILLLDEPTASLDKYNENLVEKLVFDIIGKNKITTLWVTHKESINSNKIFGNKIFLHKNNQ